MRISRGSGWCPYCQLDGVHWRGCPEEPEEEEAETDKTQTDDNLLKAYLETNLTPTEIRLMQRKLMFIETTMNCEDDYAPKPHIREYFSIPEDFWGEESGGEQNGL